MTATADTGADALALARGLADAVRGARASAAPEASL